MVRDALDQAQLLQLVSGALELCETGVLIHDEEKILYANARLAKQIEVPLNLTGAGEPIVDLIDFCARRGDYGVGVTGAAIIERSLRTTRDGRVYETERVTPSGRVIKARIAGLPDGAAIASYNDVSELVAARQAAAALAGEMEQRVVERTAELAASKDKAEQANRAKSRFLANISHELRTPLNAVIGFTEILEEDIASGSLSDASAHVGRVLAAARHLLRLIDDLLDLSLLEAGMMIVATEEADAASVARRSLEAVAHVAVKRGVSCALLVGRAPSARADPSRVVQCLVHMLSNAVRSSPNGEVTLRVRPADLDGKAAVAWDVIDNGVGMSAETVARLFRPFTQSDDSNTRPHDGAGLGLSITRGLARLMGGDVTVQSTLGEGSTFTLLLPASASSSAH